jgi:hypothetical protein
VKASLKNRRKGNSNSASSVRPNKFRLPAIAAVGSACSLAAGGASALELGDIQVESTLGQPLRASIAYALNPSEQIHNYCIFLRSGLSADGLPLLSRARIRVSDGAIVLAGGVPIREPMLSMQLSINCPYTAKLVKDFTLMFDPAGLTQSEPVALTPPAAKPESPVATQAAPAPATAQSPVPVATQAPAAAPTVARAPAASPAPQARQAAAQTALPSVPTQSQYRVQPGDTLSEIVSRIENRPPGLWQAVGHVYAANPHAFIDGDMNMLKAGSVLDIPDLYAAAGMPAQPASSTVADSAAEAPASAPATSAYEGAAAADSDSSAFETGFTTGAEQQAAIPEVAPAPVPDVAEPAAVNEPLVAPEATQAEVAQPATTPAADNSALAEAIPQIPVPVESIRPGDVVVATDIPVSETGTTGIEARTAPSVGVPDAAGGGRSWLLWLGGTGIALILGLLLFGRRIRDQFDSMPSGPFATNRVAKMRAEEEARQAATDHAATIIDRSRRNKKLTLDADLGSGSGLMGSNEIDVSQDFGYDTREVSALSAENIAAQAAAEGDTSGTDVVPLLRVEESMILEREVPPDHSDNEDEDASMILDMSTIQTGEFRKPISDTGNVELPGEDNGTGRLKGLTLTEEIDLETLERDYEDELSATQAINTEVAKAAIEIAEQMDDAVPEGNTVEQPIGETAEQPIGETAEQPIVEPMLPIGEVVETVTETPEPLGTVDENIFGDDITDLTAALPTLSEFDGDLTGPTSLLPNTKAPAPDETAEMTGMTNEMTAQLPLDSGAVNDDNVGHLDATGIIEDPTANMPNFEEELTLEMDLDLISGETKDKKKKVG